MRHLLDIADLSAASSMLHLSLRLAELRAVDGRGWLLIFEKPSNRTRQSMEMAVVQLGGIPSTPAARRSASTCARRSRT
jgi:ornithine carbamoyltransferase